MITERDLHEAIAEMQGVRNPDANTCLKLASYYTILDHTVESKGEEIAYSYAPPPQNIEYSSDSEFWQRVKDRDKEEVWALIDELIQALEVINPRLYQSFMRKLL